jgi:hypothetical protein
VNLIFYHPFSTARFQISVAVKGLFSSFNIDDIKSKKATEAKIGSKTGKTRVAYYDTYDMPTT